MRHILLLILCALSLSASADYEYSYWFDSNQQRANKGTTTSSKLHLDIDASTLIAGLHSLTFCVLDNNGYVAHDNTFFVKVPEQAGTDLYEYDYWFDTNKQKEVKGQTTGPTINLDLDASHLAPGLHSLSFTVRDKGGFVAQDNTFFIKVAENADMDDNGSLFYYIDDSPLMMQSDIMKDGIAHVELDAASLRTGLHTIYAYVANNGQTSQVVSTYFIRLPDANGIKSYTWWINDDIDNAVTQSYGQAQDCVSLLEDAQLAAYPIRADKSYFTVEKGTPVAYALNTFHFKFNDQQDVAAGSEFDYIDIRTRQEVEAKGIVSGSKETDFTLQEDSVVWYKFDGKGGDSIEVNTNDSSIIEVFTPTGESLSRIEGDSVSTKLTAALVDDGIYYIAIHTTSETPKSFYMDFYQNEYLTGLKPKTTEQKTHSSRVYDLNGRKVSGTLRPGIYIIDGKKVLVR